MIRLKREARMKGGFYVCPEAKLLFVIRIRGYVISKPPCEMFFFLIVLLLRLSVILMP